MIAKSGHRSPACNPDNPIVTPEIILHHGNRIYMKLFTPLGSEY